MVTKKNRIGVLTGGGDCAGLNAAVKWVVKTALDQQLEKNGESATRCWESGRLEGIVL
jgi:hypothetical protein